MDYEAWRCCHDTTKFCPEEGCPVSHGCARDKGWQPGQPSPRECQGLPPLENMASHKNYSPLEVALVRLMATMHASDAMTEAQLVRVTELDRVEVRRLVDDGRDMLRKRPLQGQWGTNMMRRMAL